MRTKLETKEIKKFIKIAKKYCRLIEVHENIEREKFLKKLNKVLPKLYYRVIQLPSITTNKEVKEKYVSDEEWKKIFSSLQNKLENWTYYWDVFDPNDLENTDSGCSDLADDLADIYRDIKLGLNYWAKGTFASQCNALWHWKFIFWVHTGQHITGAIRAIFWRLSKSTH